jgi:pimeloyl-ACP methyl ester carboxylesterase
MLLRLLFATILTDVAAFGTAPFDPSKFGTAAGSSGPSKFGAAVGSFDLSKFGATGGDSSKFGDAAGSFDLSKFSSPAPYDPSKKPSDRPGVDVAVDTHLGLLEVQMLEPPGGSGPLAIAFHGSNPSWTHIMEFDIVASRLAEQGYRVLLPNLHSNPKAAPAIFGESFSDANFSRILMDLVELHTSDRNDRGVLPLLLGKSWGGGASARFTAKYPNMVSKLVLVCPGPAASVQTVQALSMPLRVFWARDDPVTPFSFAMVYEENAPQVELFAVDTGGHLVLPEYTDPILAFAASP